MFQPLSIRNQRCPNQSCNSVVILHGQKRKRFKCSLCGITWSARIGSPLYGLRKDEEKIREAEKLFVEGASVRKIAAKIAVSPSTVQRWKKRFRNYPYRDFYPPTRA